MHHLPLKQWKLLRHRQLQEPSPQLVSKERVFVLGSHIWSTRKWAQQVLYVIFRLFWGFSYSRVGFKILFFAACAFNVVSFLVIMLSSSKSAYLAFYTLNSISLGGFMVIFPNACLIIFGKKIGESIYSYYWVIFSLSNFFQFGITLLFLSSEAQS